MKKAETNIKYPGKRVALDGNTAVIMAERESSDAAGAYPITPSTQMGEYWAEEAARGHLNISGRPLIFIEPEGEHAAAAVTAGLSMTGLRSANFSSGQGIAYMHESLYAAVGKRLTYVLNMGCRAMTKATLNVHAGHDDYHCVDDTGFFQVFAKDAQTVSDLNIIAHRIAEMSLTPGIVAQDGFLTTHLIESMLAPERDLILEYLGLPDDIIPTPTPAQRIIYGDSRRRIPLLWDVDNPMMAGIVQNQDSYMQSVAAQRPFFFDHIQEITDQAFNDFAALTGRHYSRVMGYRLEDADYILLGQGSVVPSAEVTADYLRKTRGIKVGVVDLVMFRPFPARLIGQFLKGRKGVTVLERIDQPLASDLPLVREIRATLSRCLENGQHQSDKQAKGPLPYPDLESYEKLSDLPPVYSASFGMGSRDLQPEGLIGAVENMLPDGARKKFFYLSIDFIREKAITPKQQIHQEAIKAAYPDVQALSVKGSENPNLMPEGAITVRFHSIGGWGAITTGKNLAMTLFDLLGYHIKANPRYGSEKKGQPTTYYLAAAPEPIRINCEYFFVDVVMSPDPNVFKHTNALAGLKEGGVFIIQSDESDPVKVWQSIPERFQKIFKQKKIKLFFIDAFKIAREEATDSELQFRMQGIAFQGCFFAASPVMSQQNLTGEELFKAIEDQLKKKFGDKGARVVADNLRVVRRGFSEIGEVTSEIMQDGSGQSLLDGFDLPEPPLPVTLKRMPVSSAPLSDIHRFWEQTGNFYLRGMANDNLTDPFIGLSVMPAATASFRDMTGIRFEHPQWIAENCTGCGNCWTVCPDTAIPGLVNDVSQVCDTVVSRLQKAGHELREIKSALRPMESRFRKLAAESEGQEKTSVTELMRAAINQTISANGRSPEQMERLKEEFKLFEKEIEHYPFALTRPFWTVPEKKGQGGGLLSIHVNPETCKGCNACVHECNDDALRPVTQTNESVELLRKNRDFWTDLPTTPQKFIRVDDLEAGVGALETILLDKSASGAVVSGDGACLGCTEKTVMRLFVGTVEALMQPRVKKHLEYLEDLINRTEQHIQMKLVEHIKVSDTSALQSALNEFQASQDMTMSALSAKMEALTGGSPIDPQWLHRMTKITAGLKQLLNRYQSGTTGKGRASMGMVNATGCTSVWGSTWPFNPYPFPWANHLFQDSPSVAMGIFEGHMARMAEGFTLIRKAEMEIKGEYNPAIHDEFFQYFNWHQFTDEEFALSPPVVSVGGDGAMYDIGFQNLSRMIMSGKPIKVLVMDTQVYSNTGGQACTSGFPGQVSDMAQYGKAIQGKSEIRKEIGLIGMAHRNAYIMQSAISNNSHMIEGFIHGLQARRPALFNIYCACQPEHGIADDLGAEQARLAVNSRAYPLFRYDPDRGPTPAECLDLEGNPDMDQIWPDFTIKYTEDGLERKMELPMTFADFALTEGRFRKHFKQAPQDTWNDRMIPLHEFLELDEDKREDRYPYIWAVSKQKNQLSRVMVAKPLVEACEDRKQFWIMLKSLAGLDSSGQDSETIRSETRNEVIQEFSRKLAELVGADPNQVASGFTGASQLPVNTASTSAESGNAADSSASGEYMAPYLETENCTACDECIKINKKIFAYNSNNRAVIHNPDGGPYSDLVKAAEKCTAGVIHPGLPRDRSGKDIEKWIKRGEKYN